MQFSFEQNNQEGLQSKVHNDKKVQLFIYFLKNKTKPTIHAYFHISKRELKGTFSWKPINNFKCCEAISNSDTWTKMCNYVKILTEMHYIRGCYLLQHAIFWCTDLSWSWFELTSELNWLFKSNSLFALNNWIKSGRSYFDLDWFI